MGGWEILIALFGGAWYVVSAIAASKEKKKKQALRQMAIDNETDSTLPPPKDSSAPKSPSLQEKPKLVSMLETPRERKQAQATLRTGADDVGIVKQARKAILDSMRKELGMPPSRPAAGPGSAAPQAGPGFAGGRSCGAFQRSAAITHSFDHATGPGRDLLGTAAARTADSQAAISTNQGTTRGEAQGIPAQRRGSTGPVENRIGTQAGNRPGRGPAASREHATGSPVQLNRPWNAHQGDHLPGSVQDRRRSRQMAARSPHCYTPPPMSDVATLELSSQQIASGRTRLAALRARLVDADLGGLLVNCEHDIWYLTGFVGHSALLMVTADRSVIICDRRYEELLQAWDASDLFEVVMGARHQLGDAVKRLAAEAELDIVGIQAESMTIAYRDSLDKSLEGLELRPTTGLVASMRRCKEPGELALIERAVEIQEAALKSTLDALEPGTTESSLAARLEYEMRMLGADGASFEPIIGSGPNSSVIHHIPGSRPIEDGMLLVDWGARC